MEENLLIYFFELKLVLEINLRALAAHAED